MCYKKLKNEPELICIMMNSKMLGKNISVAEVTHISSNEVWLLSGDKELFMFY